MDSFYKGISTEKDKALALTGDYNFDHPDAFDWDAVRQNSQFNINEFIFFNLTRRRPIKPNLANFRVWRVIAKDWRDVEPIKIAETYAKPTLYNINEVLIFKK